MSDLFTPIVHPSVADAVVAQIEEMIATGILKQGARLPAERDLAESLSVSRPKLREALKALEDRGLIEVRRGEGTFIARLIGDAMSPSLIELYARQSSAFFDYLEFRHEQEGFASYLAAERATDSDKELIARIMEELKTCQMTGDAAASKSADIRFHTAIVDASHNSLLVHTMASIYQLTQRTVFYNRDFLKTLDGTGELLLQQHLEMGQAILDGRAEDARAAAQAHIRFVEESFRKAFSQSQREARARRRLAFEDRAPVPHDHDS